MCIRDRGIYLPPFWNRAPLSFLAIFLKTSRKIETLRLIFGEVFVLFTYELFQKQAFFGGTTTSSGPCSSAYTCSKFLFLLGFLVRVHIFNLVQVWGQYLFSTPSYGFFKNDTLLHCWSGPKRTEKQHLLFTKIALTWRTTIVFQRPAWKTNLLFRISGLSWHTLSIPKRKFLKQFVMVC